jgi:hypothetical protein
VIVLYHRSVRSALVSLALLTVACGGKQAGSGGPHAEAPTTAEPGSQTASAQSSSDSKTSVAHAAGASSWFCFSLGGHAANTQCESSETDCKDRLDVVRSAAPQTAAKASCAAHAGPVFCFEESDTSGSARLCSDTQKGCDDARKGAAAEEAKRPTGSKIGACVETR